MKVDGYGQALESIVYWRDNLSLSNHNYVDEIHKHRPVFKELASYVSMYEYNKDCSYDSYNDFVTYQSDLKFWTNSPDPLYVADNIRHLTLDQKDVRNTSPYWEY